MEPDTTCRSGKRETALKCRSRAGVNAGTRNHPRLLVPLVALTQRNGPSTGAGWGHHSSDALGGKGIRSWINKQRGLLSFRFPGWFGLLNFGNESNIAHRLGNSDTN